MDFMTTAEAAKMWGISQRRVNDYCQEGRIEGAVYKGAMWLLPSNATKPIDPRKLRKLQKVENKNESNIPI